VLTCSSLFNGSADPTTGTARWIGKPHFPPTHFTFSGFGDSSSSTGASSLTFPNAAGATGAAGGTASVTGSFTGGEGGASSTMTLSSPTAIAAACASKKGLTSLTISGGTVIFG
jgi:hypothetical protein